MMVLARFVKTTRMDEQLYLISVFNSLRKNYVGSSNFMAISESCMAGLVAYFTAPLFTHHLQPRNLSQAWFLELLFCSAVWTRLSGHYPTKKYCWDPRPDLRRKSPFRTLTSSQVKLRRQALPYQ